jgi:hypothetical protein
MHSIPFVPTGKYQCGIEVCLGLCVGAKPEELRTDALEKG